MKATLEQSDAFYYPDVMDSCEKASDLEGIDLHGWTGYSVGLDITIEQIFEEVWI